MAALLRAAIFFETKQVVFVMLNLQGHLLKLPFLTTNYLKHIICCQKSIIKFAGFEIIRTFAIHFDGKHIGELAEWSNAAVLKTVDLNGSGGSNPSLSAKHK